MRAWSCRCRPRRSSSITPASSRSRPRKGVGCAGRFPTTVFPRPSSTSTSASTSSRHRRSRSSMAFRRASRAIELGSRASVGMTAPPTRTGITRTWERRAASISRRTKSAGSSNLRRPSDPVASSQLGPITTRTASDPSIARSIASVKSAPASIDSTSMNTEPAPNRSRRWSARRPAWPAESSRR